MNWLSAIGSRFFCREHTGPWSVVGACVQGALLPLRLREPTRTGWQPSRRPGRPWLYRYSETPLAWRTGTAPRRCEALFFARLAIRLMGTVSAPSTYLTMSNVAAPLRYLRSVLDETERVACRIREDAPAALPVPLIEQ
ncbi:hypothetical protein TPA0906_06200 [Streptomyces olivaceus]|nr:hypothetical protein TPA0906_06200 [Streptomyces olivaceus]